MDKRLLSGVLLLLALCTSGFSQVRNSGFESRGPLPPYLSQENVENYRKAGWTCPDVADWPQWWSLYGKNGTAAFPKTDGVKGGFAKISGAEIYLNGYHGLTLENLNYVYTIWARGKGRLRFHVCSYGKDDEGRTIQLTKAGEAAASMSVEVNSEKWIRYRHLLVKTPALCNVHPWVGVERGSLDIDEVDIEPSTPALDLIIQEEEKLYGTGALIEKLDVAQADGVFAMKRQEYEASVKDFQAKSATPDKTLVEAMAKEMALLNPYVLTAGIGTVQVPYYNEMIALTRVLERIAGKTVSEAAPVAAKEAKVQSAVGYKPGERAPRLKTVTITDIRSNKVRYNENEIATTKITVINTDDAKHTGKLIAVMNLDLDTRREIGRTDFVVGPSETKGWSLSYSVGPETYGRGIEVRFEDEKGAVLDRWQEFYAVAAEWFRIQQPSNNGQMKSYTVDPFTTYWNQQHNFASEPTDWGVQTEECAKLEQYLSGQPLYHLNMPARRASYVFLKNQLGIMGTFYQNMSYNGQMGYEVIRLHPEFALYGSNGQFAVDAVYGGYPNPMELASPMEIGPKRNLKKIYLDRRLTCWQHGMVNLAREEVVRYMAERIKEQAGFLNCEGVYIDGNVGVWTGYAYDGKLNVSGGKAEDYAELNARNHNLFSEILKKDNPNFGTWYNWAFRYTEWFLSQGWGACYLGSGTGVAGDPNDKNIKAVADWRNVMFLDESTGQFGGSDSPVCYPDKQMEHLCDNRDHLVQRYGANVMIGYIPNFAVSHDTPGPDRWGWATHNYFCAQMIASQHHFFTWWVPSVRPTSQFMTRYSRFIWAPDIKVVPEVEKLVKVTSPVKEIWWKRLVYKRTTDTGYDLIVHLVRIPPTPKWDLQWLDEPAPLEGVKLIANIGKGVVTTAYACRPYHFEESQQVVQQVLKPVVGAGKTTVNIPSFRYHTMVVFRVVEGK